MDYHFLEESKTATRIQGLEHLCTWLRKFSTRLCLIKAKMQTFLRLESPYLWQKWLLILGNEQIQSKMKNMLSLLLTMVKILRNSGPSMMTVSWLLTLKDSWRWCLQPVHLQDPQWPMCLVTLTCEDKSWLNKNTRPLAKNTLMPY